MIKKTLLQVALALVLVLILGAVVFYKAALPNILQASTMNLVHDVQTAVSNLHADYGEVASNNEGLIRQLKGENAEQRDYLPEVKGDLLAVGGITDPYGELLRFEPNEPVVEVRSAGADREFGTDDDITEGALQFIIGRHGGLADANALPPLMTDKK